MACGTVFTRRGSAVVGLALAAFIGMSIGAATAFAASVLPNLDQSAPSGVITRQVGTKWQLAFDSTVVNVGSGNLRLLGHRRDTTVSDMTADQIVDQSTGGTTTVANVGTMRYIQHGGHDHWHLLDFARFDLTTTGGTSLARDQKQGFCLTPLTVNNCGSGQPDLLQMQMGLTPGATDQYNNLVDGNSVDITGLSAGTYVLVQRSNPSGRLQETTLADNASSARISLRILKGGKRRVKVLATCADSATC